MPDLKKPNSHGLSRKHILEAVGASLKRLQTDYIDLYQVTQNNIIKTAFNIKQNLDKFSLPSSSLYNIYDFIRYMGLTPEHHLPKWFAQWTTWLRLVKFGMSEPATCRDTKCRNLLKLQNSWVLIPGCLCR